MKVRISSLPCRRRNEDSAELQKLIWMLIAASDDLADLEAHMVRCGDQEHWKDRAQILESICTIHERQMELAPEN